MYSIILTLNGKFDSRILETDYIRAQQIAQKYNQANFYRATVVDLSAIPIKQATYPANINDLTEVEKAFQ